jgi:UDP-N-acetylglucosamine--N-acetylmuramyl-(pentapeptide) pyrophosphoryl-undecaprenol N-acetylglucosamine transferase
MSAPLRFLLSGGGTGGHIFPAISIADGLRARFPHCEIEFVGASGRMEMDKVPAAGYRITGLPMAGFQRKQLLANAGLPWKIASSLVQCYRLLRRFQPDAVIGTGGYASAPTLWMAQRMGIPTLVQEQNSYAGVTNRWVSKRAAAVCVAYDGMEQWFPAGITHKTGNPVRAAVAELAQHPVTPEQRNAAAVRLGLDPLRPILVVLGGSLGARAINQAVAQAWPQWTAEGIQVFWQCGGLYHESLRKQLPAEAKDVHLTAFVQDMPTLYQAADLVISRAGAGTLSELTCAGLPAFLVPSPNVAEDHQTHNARALENAGAAVLVPETQISTLSERVLEAFRQPDELARLRQNSLALALPRATEAIVEHIVQAL